jgi:hypothetical protein
MSYNGYENRETWLVSLWLNNEYADYQHWTARAEEVLEEAKEDYEEDDIFTPLETATATLAEEIKESVEEHPLIDQASLYSDLLNGALGGVDWHEVAGGFLEQ